IDFETASVTRKTSNVTSACQFLFISGSTAEKITEKLGKRDKKVIIEALRNYKLEKNLENFKNVIQACNLQ
ncbi:serine/threonine protein kinase, partial [Candidatus Bathyarchaeota archaeon]